MTKARDIADFKFENITDTGTEGTKIALGTTAQRGSTQGQLRFNSSTGLAEYYTGTDFKSIDSPPTVSSVSPTNPNGSGITVTVTGSNFNPTGTTLVSFVDEAGTSLAGTSVNVTSTTSLTVVTPSLVGNNAPYDVKVENPSGLSGTGPNLISVGSAPVFTTAANTNVGSVSEGSTDFTGITTLAATDADGDAITYSASNLPSGVSISSSTAALSGTAPSVGADTDYTITVTATDAKGNAVSRDFVLTISNVTYIVASGGTESNSGNFKIHTFNNSSNFVVSSTGSGSTESDKIQWLIVGGGGGGGGGNASDGNHCSGGGGGAGGMRFNNTNDQAVTAQTYAITVGSGGSGGNGQSRGNSGGSSNIAVLNYSTSGGGGAGSAQNTDGKTGGSGGGAGNDFTTSDNGGSGNLGGYTPAEGNDGGDTSSSNNYGAGGGGGHANAGAIGTGNAGGVGGVGTANSITGTSVTYAGGGGGGSYNNTVYSGGAGGGGNSGTSPQSGTDNLGGGGGGVNEPDGSASTGGNGGKGVVIIRYRYQ